jgi:hypothetical protein
MSEYRKDMIRRKRIEWLKTVLEVAKWLIVIWLLWPIRHANRTPVDITRVVLGVLLFVIFTGKLFYDTVIMGILRHRRDSAKRDFVTLIGITLILSLVVGLLMLFVGYFMVELFRQATEETEAS